MNIYLRDLWRRTSWKVWPGAGGGVTVSRMSRVTVTRPRASQDTAIIPSHTRTEGHTSRFHLDKFVLNHRSENRWKILSWTIWTPLVMIPNVHLTHCLWLQCWALSLGYVIIVSLSPHNFSLMEVQGVCFNINNVFLLPQKLCGLWTILFTPGFCARNAFNETFIHSAFLRECQFRKAEELCENKPNSCHANTLQYCDWSWRVMQSAPRPTHSCAAPC